MEFVKSHKILFIILGFVLILIISGIFVYLKLSPDSKKDLYGNRLEDIEKYPIDDARMNEMITRAQEIEGIQSVNYHLQGRIIYINVKVTSDLPKDQAIQYANTTLEYFTDEQKTYYELQIIFYSDEESEIYPIMGSKHKTADTYKWKQE